MAKSKLWTKNFLGISLASFSIFVTFYMLTATLPIYITDNLNGNGQEIGLVTTIFIISAIIFRPFAGKWLDSVGQKKILMIGIITFLAGSILYLDAKTLGFLLVTRIIQGAGFGITTTATGGIVANVIPEGRSGEGMGYYATFMNLSMVIGPFLGLTMIHFSGHSIVFILGIIFSLLGLFCALIVHLPKHAPHKVKTYASTEKLHISQFFEKKAAPIAIAIFALTFVYAGILSFISVYAKELNLMQAASAFFVVYAVCLLLSRPFTGKWFDKYGENIVIYPSILVFAIGVLILSQSSSSFLFLLAGGLIGLGFGTISSCFQTIAIKVSPPQRRGTATATYFFLYDSGFGIGSFLLGVVATHTNYANVYLLCFFIVLFSFPLYYLLHGRKVQRRNHSFVKSSTLS